MNRVSIQAAIEYITYARSAIPESKLVKFYNDFGGLEMFIKPKLTDDYKRLRNALLQAPNFPIALYSEIITRTVKFSRDDIYTIGCREHVFGSYELFKKIWDISPRVTLYALTFLESDIAITHPDYIAGASWKRLPIVHTEACKSNGLSDTTEHYFCEQKILFYADVNLAMQESTRDVILSKFEPRVLATIQDEIFNLSEECRTFYAQSHYIRDDHWEKLAEDPKRTVINELVANALIPLSVAKELAGKHKTPALRMTLARNTTSLELLNAIWFSTKSKDIRESVEANPLFVKTALME